MAHIKDDPTVINATLPPSAPIAAPPGSSSTVRALAGTYNRLGGVLDLLATRFGIPVEAVLAVWQVESAGAAFVQDHVILRIENHVFFQIWGQHNPQAFDAHFQFGGRNGISGKPWTSHKWRPGGGAWQTFHGDQTQEYAVFDFATSLSGGMEAPAWSSSFGGPQILGKNFLILGYNNAAELAQAFQKSERWHVCGFFDFCIGSNLIARMKSKSWVEFARHYNGEGQAEMYGATIKKAFDAAGTLGLS